MYKLHINGVTKQIYYVLVVFLAFLLSGASRGFLSFFFRQLEHSNSNIKLNESEESSIGKSPIKPLILLFLLNPIAGCITLLSPLGSLLIGQCMDQIGRRNSLKLIYLPFMISWIILVFSRTVTLFYIVFIIQGIGSGMSLSVGVYISEITTPDYRGALFAITVFTYNVGIFLSNFFMYYLPWNVVAVIFFVLSLCSLLLNCSLPESPFWLYSRGNIEKSIQTLCSIRCLAENQLTSEIQDLRKISSQKDRTDMKTTFQNCFHARKQLAVLLTFYIVSICSGYILMVVFIIKIVDNLHIPYNSSQIAVNYTVIGVLASIIMPLFFHNFNRRTVLALSSSGMTISMVIIALCQEFQINSNFSWVVPASIYFYNFSANIGLIPIGFTIMGELLPNESRGIMSGICGTINFTSVTFVQKLFPCYMMTFGVKFSIWTFALISFIMTIFGIFILPETRGKTLNQIQEEYFKTKPK